MPRKIAVTGTLEATSHHGTATIKGTSELLDINFPNTKALATVMNYETMKRLRQYGGASDFLGQEVVFSVAGTVWAKVENGKVKIKSPLKAGLFYFSQWLKR
ncbi:MAG: hypothetical protein ABR572_02155 [Cryomorphaceae bacterium]|nr:hypothetical protein [Flavobacteriales bacterium]